DIGPGADRIGPLGPELVALVPWQVEHDTGSDGAAPPVSGGRAGECRGRHDEVVSVEVGVQLMQRTGYLRPAPRLVDLEIADDGGDLLRRIVAPATADSIETVGGVGVAVGIVVVDQ